ncbi:hypothetical protein L3X38_001025 [Prunus dulcis]|uniref:Protein ALP1-like n=1 Tax=Prunus dulcis TaxID=3755 RepID=A0AAD4WR88_PRUDU|nr:hypothetical protein L3X38_001025 [Prunus dulcis]
MIGSIDCMHWQWKNCPTAWQGDYGNRKGQKSIILEAVAGFDTWVWHAFFGVAGSQNDLNVLGQSPVFNDVLRGEGPNITYEINNTIYQTGYYLADGIYPRWTTFVKTIPHPRSHKQNFFARYQEGYRKDVERCFGILQARWAIIRGAARLFDEELFCPSLQSRPRAEIDCRPARFAGAHARLGWLWPAGREVQLTFPWMNWREMHGEVDGLWAQSMLFANQKLNWNDPV